MIYNLLLCLGDSLTSGARDEFGRNYPLELGAQLSTLTKEEWHCITEACNGRTSSELAQNAYSIVSRYPDVYGVLLLIGTNDSRLSVPVDVYADNVHQIIRVCRILRKKAYVISIPQISYQRHFLWYTESAARLIKTYNQFLAGIAGAHFIDVANVIRDADLIDGVHFSHEANVKLGNHLAERLLNRMPEMPVFEGDRVAAL